MKVTRNGREYTAVSMESNPLLPEVVNRVVHFNGLVGCYVTLFQVAGKSTNVIIASEPTVFGNVIMVAIILPIFGRLDCVPLYELTLVYDYHGSRK